MQQAVQVAEAQVAAPGERTVDAPVEVGGQVREKGAQCVAAGHDPL